MSLKIENLRTGYGPAVISQSLTLEIPAGKITALIGPNGCGKSTLLRTLARLQPPLAGQISLTAATAGASNPGNSPGCWPCCRSSTRFPRASACARWCPTAVIPM